MAVSIPTIDDQGCKRPVTVQAGDVYVFQCAVSTRAGVTYEAGDLLTVQDHTPPQLPMGRSVNRGTHGTSVWATLEQCIARGLLAKVDGDSASVHGSSE